MSIWTFLKVMCDVSACFAVLSGFPNAFPHAYSLLWPALICAGGAGMAAWFRDSGKDGPGIACAVLPLLCLLLPGVSAGMWVLLPAVVYTVAVILRGNMTLEYYTFRRYLKATLLGLVCLAVVLWVLAYLDRAVDRSDNFSGEAVLPMAMVHAASGILLLRQLRLGAGNTSGRKMDRRQTLLLLGGASGAALAVAALENWLHMTLMAILRGVLSLVLSPMQLLAEWFAEEAKIFIESVGNSNWVPSQSPEQNTPPPMEEVVPQPPATAPTEDPLPWVAILVTVAVVVILAVMFRSFQKRDAIPKEQEDQQALEPAQSRRQKERLSNRAKVRQYYRDFLRRERRMGLRLFKYDTSLDIQKRLSVGADKNAAEALRQVYLSARYDPNCEITPEQLRQARTALRRTRGQ